MALVTLQQAKDHLRIATPEGDPGDTDLQLKIDQATAIITDYLQSRADPTWSVDASPSTVPGNVQAAVLLMLAHLYEHRGDEMQQDEALWQAIGRLLMRFRDPVLR